MGGGASGGKVRETKLGGGTYEVRLGGVREGETNWEGQEGGGGGR